ncbi:TlpA family protein disulfide reductase [Flavihumibacter rivuli]|uniref:peroxiredoxin family protein n=1 Tax=Flavihumibacter rivuli TaxID=2838156 RepID=UPI001BDF2491|nr:TlpA disulfide reductase family protein [Flavihumibacter rivuli]ULQ56224.1 TlpA family protein disulfide reductase [Flavihumibacter rivuli]
MYNKQIRSLLRIFLTAGLVVPFLFWKNIPPTLQNGIWRGQLTRPDGQEIAFNFEVKDSLNRKILYVINGEERLLVDSISMANDSVFIQLPFFESAFRARLDQKGHLQGWWVKGTGARAQPLAFSASPNQDQRFNEVKATAKKIGGRWTAYFKQKNGSIAEAIGEFKQVGNLLTGTFLTPTGDYRFLQGVVSGDSLKLSGFDGSHAFLFTAYIQDANNIQSGKFYSGPLGVQDWHAVRNEKAVLPDAYAVSKLTGLSSNPGFRFQTTDGQWLSLSDKRFTGKVVILQILGSWCPNCIDETKFLSDYYNDPARNRQIEIVGLAYERSTDIAQSIKSVQPLVRRFNIQYPILLTGVAANDSLKAQKTLPEIDKIAAFPTTIFIDKKGNIRKIHSGFNGPATGEHHREFKKEFDQIIQELLNE